MTNPGRYFAGIRGLGLNDTNSGGCRVGNMWCALKHVPFDSGMRFGIVNLKL